MTLNSVEDPDTLIEVAWIPDTYSDGIFSVDETLRVAELSRFYSYSIENIDCS